MQLLNKDYANNYRSEIKVIEFPKYDLKVNLRCINAGEYYDFMAAMDKAKADNTYRDTHFDIKLLQMCVVDDEGNILFGDDEGAKYLSSLSPKIIRKLATEAVRLSLITDEGIGEAKNNLKN